MQYAIACPHREGALAGEDAFRSGGSAIDAALAAAAVLTVVYPHMCAIGGDAMALVARPDGTVTAVIGAGVAPSTAAGESISVPGMVDAWGAVAKLGSVLPWQDLLAPAIGLAREGTALAPGVARALDGQPQMRAHFRADLVQPALAATLERIAQNGPRELYEGVTGQRLAEAAEIPFAARDLSVHASELMAPIAAPVDGLEVLTTGPPTQGHVLHAILAALADGEEPADAFRRTAAARDRQIARERSGGDTVAIVAADADGHAISLIQSVYGEFGAGVVEPRTGILLHDRTALPGKRPAHTLMPVLARRGAAVEIVQGTMGGWAQPQINAQVLLRLLAGATAQEAVAAPRIGDEGHAQAIRRLPDGGFDAGSDPRADGEALAGTA